MRQAQCEQKAGIEETLRPVERPQKAASVAISMSSIGVVAFQEL
jgi:hypothetical protein